MCYTTNMVKALIIIDMVQKYSQDIYADKKLVNNQLALISWFQKKQLPVIAAVPGKGISKQKGNNPIMIQLWGDELKGDNKRKSGKKLGDLIPELQHVTWNKLVKKPEYSAFYNTDLERYCKRRNITELYLCGIYSGVCVHYSGIDAAQRRIWPILITDASTTSNKKWHKDNCKRFAQIAGKITSTSKIIST